MLFEAVNPASKLAKEDSQCALLVGKQFVGFILEQSWREMKLRLLSSDSQFKYSSLVPHASFSNILRAIQGQRTLR